MILYLGNKLLQYGYTPTSVETLGVRLAESGYIVVLKSNMRNKFLRMVDMLYSIFKYKNYNPIVIIDTYSSTAFWYAFTSAVLCKILKLSYVPILRGGNLTDRLLKSPAASKFIFNNSKINIAVSKYLNEIFIKHNFRVKLIHNYIDIENYPFKNRAKVGPRLLWVRSFHQVYNPNMAIFVLQKLKLHYPEAVLCMIGPDKDTSLIQCKSLAEELNLSVTFPGKLEKKDWIASSANYDIFINTTNFDNAPISVMEAMALGLPVVSTNAGGLPYMITHEKDGLLVAKNSVEEMVAAIISLLRESGKAERISINARKKAESWDWAFAKKQWQQLLDNR